MKPNKEYLNVWCGAIVRGLVVGGMTIFSVAVTLGFCYDSFETGLIMGGLYMFGELARYYKITLPNIPRKKACYKFLLFP